ncbi:MAG: glycosyltransferase family 4 protein [Proteobacteria bacterium]|nr:glycosyltransferase family 4 protein [Pseudomonadota bacterium]
MNILLTSHAFLPQLGGIEFVSATLAREFVAAGHHVRVITHTPADGEDALPYEVYRRPNARQTARLLQWCDVHLQSNISLRYLWPAVLLRTPSLVTYHTWLQRPDGTVAWQDRVKRLAMHWVTKNLAVSGAVAASLPGRVGVIRNPYDDQTFKPQPQRTPLGDLVFLGRLVDDKGVDLLVDAMAVLHARGIRPTLSIVGSGPEEAALRDQADRLGLAESIAFLGKRSGPALARTLAAHRVLVVPSRWQEPFGVVVLEGLACGLRVVASDIGGLPEAVGACGRLFRPGSAESLADMLEKELQRRAEPSAEALDSAVDLHLTPYRASSVAAEYLEHLSTIRKRQTSRAVHDELAMTFDDSFSSRGEHQQGSQKRETSA